MNLLLESTWAKGRTHSGYGQIDAAILLVSSDV